MLRTTIVLLLCVLLPSAAMAQKRVALVIGNSAYQHTPALANPRNDATDMAAALKKLGFQVNEGFDLDKASFDRKVRDFAGALSGAKAGVFYYAGHGLQVTGANYLVPVDAKLSTASALDWEMVRLDLVQRTMERETETNVLFLDACRDNPLARNLERGMGTRSTEIGRGLALMESGIGTLISFSTQPGNVALDGTGRNSPFAGALVRHISASKDDLSAILINVRNDVMKETQRKQVPWEHSALTGRFYFDPSAQTVMLAPPKGPAAPSTLCDGIEVLVGNERRCLKPGSGKSEWFKDCPACPEMVVVPAGRFTMGSPEDEPERLGQEDQVSIGIARPFAVGRFAVTRGEFAVFVAATGHMTNGGCHVWTGKQWMMRADASWRAPGFTQTDRHPVVCVTWNDAKAFVAWLSKNTGKTYRLLSEAEREYVARAGTTTPFWWGSTISTAQANYDGNYTYPGGTKGGWRKATAPVDTFAANPWGLYNVHGNAADWTEDCWNERNAGNPADGSARTAGDCSGRVLRGGYWNGAPKSLRSAYRFWRAPVYRWGIDGLRVARTLE